MKQSTHAASWRQAFLLPIFLFFLCSFHLHAQQCSIAGPSSACTGMLSDYHITVNTSNQYTVIWNTIPANAGSVVVQNNQMATIHWDASGGTAAVTATVKIGNTIFTTCSVNTTILPEPHPMIEPSYLPESACLTKDVVPIGEGNYPVNASGYCANTTVVFHANGMGGDYLWNVSGGAQIIGSNTLPDVTVQTGPIAGTFHVELTESNAGGCSNMDTRGYEIFALPVASFTEISHSTAAPINVCRGEDLLFLGSGTDPNNFMLNNWNWSVTNISTNQVRGAGSQQNFQYTFNEPGSFLVTFYTVSCLGCTSLPVTVQVNVSNDARPDIVCPSVVCQSAAPVQYCAVPDCGSYVWSVTDGVIQGGNNNKCMDVVWNTVPANGYGVVTLQAMNCQPGVCTLPTSVEVPVIPSVQPITGAHTICSPNGTYNYSVPFWPGAQYSWTVQPAAGSTGSVSPLTYVAGNNLPVTLTNFGGSFTVSVTITHPVAGCMGSGSLTVNALRFAIQPSPQVLCYGTDASFSISPDPATISPNYRVNWRIYGKTYDHLVNNSPNWTIPFAEFGTNGVYVVYADVMLDNGQMISCEALSTNVLYLEEAPAIKEIIGPGSICPQQTYSYTASLPTPGVIHWVISGGTPATATGPSVNVTWGNGPDYGIKAFRTDFNQCNSAIKSLPISAYTGPLTATFTPIDGKACSDGTIEYTADQLDGDEYLWTITNSIKGTIISGQGTPIVKILWHQLNGVSTTAKLKLKIKKCGAEAIHEQEITIENLKLVISCPDGSVGESCDVCQGSLATYVANGIPNGTFQWYVDEILVPGQTTKNFKYTFLTPGTHYIRVMAMDDNCPGTFGDVKRINVIPNPSPVITASDILLCEDPHPITLFATSYAGATSEIFTWTPHTDLGNGSTLPLPIDINNIQDFLGFYSVTVEREIDGLTCLAVATYNLKCIPKEEAPDPTVIHFDSWQHKGDIPCNACGDIPNECGHFTVTGNLGNHSFLEVDQAQWHVIDPNDGLDPVDIFTIGLQTDLNNYEISTFTKAGFYQTNLEVKFIGSDALVYDTKYIEVPLVPDFIWSMNCCTDDNGVPGYSLALRDISGVAANNPILKRHWRIEVNGVLTDEIDTEDSQYATGCIFKAGDHVKICLRPETVFVGDENNGQPYACTQCKEIDVPLVAATLNIQASVLKACVGNVVAFTSAVLPNADQVIKYEWVFPDGSYSAAANTFKSFNSPGVKNVVLNIRLVNGCTISKSIDVEVGTNNITGNITAGTNDCGGTTMLSFSPAQSNYHYLWNPFQETGSSIMVNNTGVYTVTVTNDFGCTISRTREVTVSDPFYGLIEGDFSACPGQTIRFDVAADPGFSYVWTSDYPGFAGGTFTTVSFPVQTPGTYYIKVTALKGNVMCSSLMENFTVHAAPAAPHYDINYNCDPFFAHITTDPNQMVAWTLGGSFIGYLSELVTSRQGAYTLTTTNQYGCTASASVNTLGPINLSTLSGCYTACSNAFDDCKLSIPPPTGIFTNWSWVHTEPGTEYTLDQGVNSAVKKLCLTPAMAGKIVLRVTKTYTNSDYDPVTGNSTTTPVNCSAQSDPFCLTVKECFVCPTLTVTPLLSSRAPVVCGPYGEHVYAIEGNFILPTGYNECGNPPVFTGGYINFTQYVPNNSQPFHLIKIKGFVHVTDFASFDANGLVGTINLCNASTGEVCPAKIIIPPIMCMDGMNLNCNPANTFTIYGPIVTQLPNNEVKVKYCFNLHFQNGTPCSINQYTVKILRAGTGDGVLATQVFNATVLPSDQYQCVEFTMNKYTWTSMNNCVGFSITSNCPDVSCAVSNFCGNSGPYGGFQGDGGLSERSNYGIDDAYSALSVAPNPANDLMHISYTVNAGNNTRLVFRNSIGALVKTLPITENDSMIDISAGDWPAGIYLVSIEQDGKIVQAKKIIIQR